MLYNLWVWGPKKGYHVPPEFAFLTEQYARNAYDAFPPTRSMRVLPEGEKPVATTPHWKIPTREHDAWKWPDPRSSTGRELARQAGYDV